MKVGRWGLIELEDREATCVFVERTKRAMECQLGEEGRKRDGVAKAEA